MLEGSRLRELDSVRGIASLTVVLLHFYDMWMPTDRSHIPHWQKIMFLLLKPLYSGSEAVILFFVLSGLVLSLPYLRGKGKPYPIFLKRRVLRIYGPYLAAIVVSIGGSYIWHGHHPYIGEWGSSFWSEPSNIHLI